jgi:XTP/dITP diphosphohydrolase
MLVWFATGNTHKKEELSAILRDAVRDAVPDTARVEVKIPSEAGLVFDPPETGTTFLENALIKAGALHRLLGEGRFNGPVIADDSGICVDALGGRPGVFSARYCGPEGGPPGSGGAGRGKGGKLTDAERNSLLLAEVAGLPGGGHPRTCRFVCAMVLYYGPNRFYAALESTEGELVRDIEAGRGSGGFGYDPVFYLPELGRTVAELSPDEKNRLSHRAKAGRVIAGILTASAKHRFREARLP